MSIFHYYRHVKVETYYLVSSSSDHVRGWAHNATYYWGNTIQSTCTDRYGLKQPLFSDQSETDDDLQWSLPQTINPVNVGRVEGLNYGRYLVQRYNTFGSGGLLGSPFHNWTDIFGRLKIDWYGQVPDFAFRADRDPMWGRMEESEVIGERNPDTVDVCKNDTIYAGAIFFSDTLGKLHYEWYLNGNLYSTSWHPRFVFNIPGLHVMRVDIYDGALIASYEQVIKVEDCEQTTARISSTNAPLYNYWEVYPNPVSETLHVDFNADISILKTISIYSLDGKQLLFLNIFRSECDIDVSFLSPGVYLVDLRSDNQREYFKVLKIQR